uniref:Nucleolar protein 58 n=1 Tax=Timspurckia oligopyrenoides TaxID=708627 RepID=A0A7S1EQ03_9RHOD|mmetsp:Transcript_11576/g.20935  ORF Transcript_11576/g.20935 Transcript_11576/m.20935 type:complete len:506 (+) Transcript_11576:20-1537(+)
MLVLFETPSGHALFKITDEAKAKALDGSSDVSEVFKLKAFRKFDDTLDALSAATATVEGSVSKQLKKLLKKHVDSGEKLMVGDAKLGGAVKESMGIKCVFDNSVMEIMREVRSHVDELLGTSSAEADQRAMSLGLAHSLSRYKLKFSPDKVDTMIVQAIGLLDDLDKEINTYAMRLREWYGWHFPELAKVVSDNLAYAKLVLKMKVRTAAKSLDFSDCVPEDVEQEVKHIAEISMGTEISEEDTLNISALADQVVTLMEYRSTLYEYLKNRMNAIAPNLSAMVGELVGARLISHAGSLMTLAKYPASTIQILGAEKALFRALKTKHATPKYGIIYHASLVGQAPPKLKGKISRVLAAKCALSIRTDALADDAEGATVGLEGRERVEARLMQLEGKSNGFAISRQNGNGSVAVSDRKIPAVTEPKPKYNPAADVVEKAEDSGDENRAKKKSKKDKNESSEKKSKDGKKRHREDAEVDPEKSKKKEKKSKVESEATEATPKKKKSKK